MAILTINQMADALKKFIGDRTDDEALSFMEDVMDTVTASSEISMEELQNKIDTLEEEKAALEEEKAALDAEWRDRYKERFFERPIIDSNTSLDSAKDIDTEPVTFEDLFEETEE